LTPDERWARFLSRALAGKARLVCVPAGGSGALERGDVGWFERAADLPRGTGLWSVAFPLAAAPGTPPGALAALGEGPPADVVVEESLARAEDERLPPADPIPADSARLLFLLARARRSRSALEIGTGSGVAALFLASALCPRAGRLVTVERDSALAARARLHLRRTGLAGAVDLRMGEAERILPRTTARFDLVLLDADPGTRTDHLALVLPLCLPGALVVSRGAIKLAARLARYQAAVRTQPAVRTEVSVAAGDGLALALLA
jgi:predicted O-methyltransferase YrrM